MKFSQTMEEEKILIKPSVENSQRVVKNSKPIDDKKESTVIWRSCCLEMDKRAVMFFTTLGISVAVMIFCGVKLSFADTCDETNTWMALLTFILGIWIKTPAL